MEIDFTKKDLSSLKKHEHDITKTEDVIAWTKREYAAGEIYKQYEVLGYQKMVEGFPQVRALHIDIGCGGGWLVSRTSPVFKKVIGIDPSEMFLDIARDINGNNKNVEFICGDMAEVLQKLDLKEPVFITTCTVLSHIKTDWVVEFLKLVNSLPKGSTLFFGEYYGINSRRDFWQLHSKWWWAKNLPNWQLVFNTSFLGKTYGICGVNVGKENVLTNYEPDFYDKLRWKFSGIYNKSRSVGHKLKKSVGFIKNNS